jgi:hypothetical protein
MTTKRIDDDKKLLTLEVLLSCKICTLEWTTPMATFFSFLQARPRSFETSDLRPELLIAHPEERPTVLEIFEIEFQHFGLGV